MTTQDIIGIILRMCRDKTYSQDDTALNSCIRNIITNTLKTLVFKTSEDTEDKC